MLSKGFHRGLRRMVWGFTCMGYFISYTVYREGFHMVCAEFIQAV